MSHVYRNPPSGARLYLSCESVFAAHWRSRHGLQLNGEDGMIYTQYRLCHGRLGAGYQATTHLVINNKTEMFLVRNAD